MRIAKRWGAALVLLASALAACGSLIGIEPLSVDPQDASTTMIVAVPAADAAAPSQLPAAEGGPLPSADSGPRKKRVFLTSTTMAGNIIGATGADGGLLAADEICRDLAAKAALDGVSWRAWLSTSDADAIARITPAGAYYRVDDVEVVTSKAQLASGNLLMPIIVMEDGGFLVAGESSAVWTGTGASGVKSGFYCYNWASNHWPDVGTVGAADKTDTTWTGKATVGCNASAHLYCFEQ